MDYHNTYSELYLRHCQDLEALAIKEILKGKKDELSYETTLQNIYELFRSLKNDCESEIKKNNLEEAQQNFYKFTTLYNPKSALEKTINISLFDCFKENSNSNITYTDFLNTLAKYWAADYIKSQVYNSRVFNEDILYDSDLKNFTLKLKVSPIENLSEYQNNLKNKHNIGHDLDITDESFIEVIKWKKLISQFSHREKLILISIYIKIQKTVQRPELLKLIMITNGIFNLSILNGTYKNEKFYKMISQGVDYYQENQIEIIADLLIKLKPFEMEKISKALLRNQQLLKMRLK
ncbi:hypothetical protein Q2T41_16995 [Maribacter confluentis]|uniref:Uncharacterized protein n=1 Tax=Maribacter confluentis TaxID=1656093 RepID=A0ABT8RTW8_9FLAO|nr:hypothetical protein [Maribacter confluentis]MDO1514354.1 hypothetical protein [Maribacter confluentis]